MAPFWGTFWTSWGFTPAIRFQRNAAGDNKTAVTLAAHFGWAF